MATLLLYNMVIFLSLCILGDGKLSNFALIAPSYRSRDRNKKVHYNKKKGFLFSLFELCTHVGMEMLLKIMKNTTIIFPVNLDLKKR